MSDRIYTCAQCNEVYETHWTEEDCKKEAIKNFPDWDQQDKVVVCEDCYQKIMAQKKDIERRFKFKS